MLQGEPLAVLYPVAALAGLTTSRSAAYVTQSVSAALLALAWLFRALLGK